MELFLIALSFTGVVAGTAAGALSAWRGWHALKAFTAALVLSAALIWASDLAGGFDFQASVGALVLAPLVAFFPAGAGFVVGRGAVLRWLGK